MTRTLAGLLLLVGVIGCTGTIPRPANSATRAASPTPSMTPTPTVAWSPSIDCRIAAADCGPAWTAVLAALRPATPLRPDLVLLGKGSFCPDPALLFADTSCPPAMVYWGSALVTLAGTQAQAYLDLQGHGSAITAHLIAIAVPPPTPTPGSS